MTRNPDMIRFSGGDLPRFHCGWSGPWPPPERLGLAYGRESGLHTVFDPAETDVALLESVDSIDFAIYERRSASSLPDSFEASHVFRGADYRPIEVTSSTL